MGVSPGPRGPFRSPRLIVAVAVVVGLVFRLAFGLGYWLDKPLTHDEREYLALAHSLATGSGFTYSPESSTFLAEERFSRAPLYPAFIAMVAGSAIDDSFPDSSPSAVKVAQAVIGSIGVLLIAIVAWRAAGPGAGGVAAWVAALYPPLVWIPAYVFSETLYSMLALLTVVVLGMVTDRSEPPRPGHAVGWVLLSGVLGALASLTRPPAVAFLVLAAVWLGTRPPRRLAVCLVLGAVLVLTPWTVRNFQEHGRFIIVSAQGGVNFWIGNHPFAQGEGDMAANPAIKQANVALRQRHRSLTPEELEPIYYREALAWVVDNPVAWAGLLVRKFFYLWVPIGPSYTLHSPRYMWASVLSHFLILPFAVAGGLRLWRARQTPVALGLMAAAAVLTAVLFFPQERFRVPVLDPTLIVCASVWGATVLPNRMTEW